MNDVVKVKEGVRFRMLFWFLIWLLCVILIFMGYQGYILYKLRMENNSLVSLKNEYENLVLEINKYKMLKVDYEVILNEGSGLSDNKELLEKKIVELDNGIKDLELKISDVNKKIKDLS